MKFEQLKEYLTDECGCNVTHIGDNFYVVKNCINGNPCVIQDEEFYSTQALCHYFYELNVDIPDSLQDMAHIYTNFREHIHGHGFVRKEI